MSLQHCNIRNTCDQTKRNKSCYYNLHVFLFWNYSAQSYICVFVMTLKTQKWILVKSIMSNFRSRNTSTTRSKWILIPDITQNEVMKQTGFYFLWIEVHSSSQSFILHSKQLLFVSVFTQRGFNNVLWSRQIQSFATEHVHCSSWTLVEPLWGDEDVVCDDPAVRLKRSVWGIKICAGWLHHLCLAERNKERRRTKAEWVDGGTRVRSSSDFAPYQLLKKSSAVALCISAQAVFVSLKIHILLSCPSLDLHKKCNWQEKKAQQWFWSW